MPNSKAVGVAFSDPLLDGAVMGTTTGTAGFYGKGPVARQAALTTQLTSITIADAAGTPDYAIQAVINSSAWGLASQQELISLLYVIQNLQVRVGQLETKLSTYGLLP